MMEAGLIRQSDKRVDPELDDQRRVHYEIARAGRAALAAELERYLLRFAVPSAARQCTKRATTTRCTSSFGCFLQTACLR